MNIAEQTIPFAGTLLTLTNQAALFWAAQHALVLSDLHLGKAAHFRKNGIAIPSALAADDMNRLEQLLHHYHPKRVIITGDLLHAGANKEALLFSVLVSRYPGISFELVKGNHDRITTRNIQALGIQEIYEQLCIDDICLQHLPASRPDIPHICGHIHPGVILQLPAGDTLRLPCYVVTEMQLILPAFSRFTGLDTRSLPATGKRYAFYEEGLVEIP